MPGRPGNQWGKMLDMNVATVSGVSHHGGPLTTLADTN